MFSDFVNFDDCIRKITTKSIRLLPVYVQKRFEVNKKLSFSSEKMRDSGYCIHDYRHSFFGKNFYPMRIFNPI